MISQPRATRLAPVSVAAFITSVAFVFASTPLSERLPGLGSGLRLLIFAWAGGFLNYFARGNTFADSHLVLWTTVACFISTILFLIPASILFFATRRQPVVTIVVLITWFWFYLCSLFILFPATQGF
jgi:hypothetical protein